jgi:hypothetical protein
MLVFAGTEPETAKEMADEEEALQCGADDRAIEAGAGGVPVAEVIRKAGISEQTFYRLIIAISCLFSVIFWRRGS